MTASGAEHRCEVCGAAGPLVQFGDARGYRYHCLTCWQDVAEQVVVAYVEASETAPREGGPVPDA
jgi:hypothetical protein